MRVHACAAAAAAQNSSASSSSQSATASGPSRTTSARATRASCSVDAEQTSSPPTPVSRSSSTAVERRQVAEVVASEDHLAGAEPGDQRAHRVALVDAGRTHLDDLAARFDHESEVTGEGGSGSASSSISPGSMPRVCTAIARPLSSMRTWPAPRRSASPAAPRRGGAPTRAAPARRVSDVAASQRSAPYWPQITSRSSPAMPTKPPSSSAWRRGDR